MNALTRMRTHMGVWALLALSMVISGCGGGSSGMSSMNGSSNPQTCMDCGNAIMTITDAQGQFTSYDVSVTSIQLKKANGAAVETLPKTTNIDFAQLVDLSEVLSAGQIPAGDYVAASISLDYTNATLIVDNGTTAGLKVSPVDSNGKAITTLTLDVQLDNKNHLVITPGQIARLALDFNLLASNTVDMNKATVTVQPILVASVTPADTKQIRVRGALDSVDTAKSQYVIDVMPFHEASSSLGQVTVHTTSTTTYEINGTSFTGAAGLQALAALKAGTMTAAFGTVQTSDKTFTAANVLAGTSLEDKNLDHLLGDVVARSGNSLTVRGIETGLRDGEFFFGRGNITVTVGPNTVVTEEGQTGKFDISAISVGQRIDVFGTQMPPAAGAMTGNSVGDSVVGTTFDATSGRVRLDITPLSGMVINRVTPTSTGGGSVTLNLLSIDGRSISQFNFAGTGKTAADDAKPTNYIVNTQTLPLAGLMMNEPTRLFGFVTPFGSAPPDFQAITVVDFSAVRAELEIDWLLKGTTAPFTTLNNTQLVLDLNNPNIGAEHEIEVGPLNFDLKSFLPSPMIVPNTSSTMQLYAIGHIASHKVENFNSFADFTAALTTTLNGSTLALSMDASGSFNSTTNTFTADHIVIVVNN